MWIATVFFYIGSFCFFNDFFLNYLCRFYFFNIKLVENFFNINTFNYNKNNNIYNKNNNI
jgi:hypothetical protein